jgi:hypothetical protein
MKIAYCYFGLLRSLESTLNSQIEFLPELISSDIFMHTWYQKKKYKYWHGASKEDFKTVISKIEFFKKKTNNFQVLQIENQVDLEGSDWLYLDNQKIVWKSGVYLWKSIHSVANISKKYNEEQESKIDYYLFLRPDISFKSILNLDDFFKSGLNLGFCGNVQDSGIYICEDLFFVIKGDQISEFIKFSEAMINIQFDLGKGVFPNSPNPILQFDSNRFHLNFRYLIDFSIIREQSFLKKIYNKFVKRIQSSIIIIFLCFLL